MPAIDTYRRAKINYNFRMKHFLASLKKTSYTFKLGYNHHVSNEQNFVVFLIPNETFFYEFFTVIANILTVLESSL